MPSAKNLAYDHIAYQSPVVHAGQTTVGANGVSPKFAAFTAMQIRRIVHTPNVASTSASQPLLYVKSGTATSTTTLTALTSAAITVVADIPTTSVALVQGDQVWVTHGTDATAVLSFAMECYLTPGASITCP